jgi:hypothetical protein
MCMDDAHLDQREYLGHEGTSRHTLSERYYGSKCWSSEPQATPNTSRRDFDTVHFIINIEH